MSFLDLLFIVAPVLFGGVVYIATNNLIISLVVLGVSLIYFFFIARKCLSKYKLTTSKFYDCYQFINSYIISLSITSSVELAYDSAFKLLSPQTKKQIETITDEHSLDAVHSVINFHVFGMFMDVIYIWEDEGNSILDSAEYVMKETRDLQDIIIENNKHGIKTALEFFILWIICLAIIVFMRFALKDFYSKILNSQIFMYGIAGIIGFMIISIQIFISRYCKLDLKEE